MPHDKDGFDVEKYAVDVAATLVMELGHIIDKVAKEHGEEVARKVALIILDGHVFATVAVQTQGSEAAGRYAAIKAEVEKTIASAFNLVFKNIDPKSQPNFVCDIYNEPPAKTTISQ